MFRTTLTVAHVDGNTWKLTTPFVWEGKWDYFVIRTGFETDFASIPKPVRWLLDSSGHNSEAAVLHDAVWRASKVTPNPTVDPWHADGIFRAALRDTGTPALTRALMWFAVRAAAIASGRFGALGPSRTVKVLQLLGIFVLGALTALGPTVVACLGLVVYWVFNWIVGVVWSFFERRRGLQTNLPWPAPKRGRDREVEAPPSERLVIIRRPDGPEPAPTPRGIRLQALLGPAGDLTSLTEAQVDEVLALPAA